jgi:pyruvate,water dikinase
LEEAIHSYCFSVYDRAIKYRHDMGFEMMDIALFLLFSKWYEATKRPQVLPSIDPDTGFKNTIIINSSWGLQVKTL